MKFSVLFSLICISSFSLALNENKRDLKIIKVTRTVDNTITNTHVVDAPTSTLVNWSTLTTTSTTTHYTSTFTSTILGDVYTYLSVYSSVIALPVVVSSSGGIETNGFTQDKPAETNVPHFTIETDTSSASAPPESEESKTSTQYKTLLSIEVVITDPTSTGAVLVSSAQGTTEVIPTTSVTPLVSVTPTSTYLSETESYVSESQITSFPSVWDGYTLEDFLTNVVSGLICIVDYDYYSDDITETMTSTSVIYKTITI